MSTGSDVVSVISAVVPALGELAAALIALGKSPDEAAELIKTNITSLRSKYEREKAEDEAALKAKHEQ